MLTWLDRGARRAPCRPRGHVTRGEQGVFNTRSGQAAPTGLHRVTVLEVLGGRLRVRNLEALDGTPIVDVKPALRSIEER